MFRPFENNPNFPKQEEAILEFWRAKIRFTINRFLNEPTARVTSFSRARLPPTANRIPAIA